MTELGFSFDMSEMDRDRLLGEAAERLQRLEASALGGERTEQESASAAIARELSTEWVRFASFPEVHRITSEDFLMAGIDVPIQYKDLTRRYDFAWIRFPIGLRPLRKWAFTRLEVGVDLCPTDLTDHLRPRAYRILPDKRFETVLEAGGTVDVHLDANFELSAQTPEIDVQAGAAALKAAAGAGGRAATGLGVAGRYRYHLKRATIDHTPTGMDKVFWRLDDTELFEEDTPEVIVILQIPRGMDEVQVAGALQAYRRLNILSAGFQAAVRGLPRALRNYFVGGAPIRHEDEWDLAPVLSEG